MKRYTPDQISYMENDCAILGDYRFYKCVVNALSKIPTEIVDDTLKECSFILLEDLGSYLPKSINKTLLIFNPELRKLSQEDIEEIEQLLTRRQGKIHGK